MIAIVNHELVVSGHYHQRMCHVSRWQFGSVKSLYSIRFNVRLPGAEVGSIDILDRVLCPINWTNCPAIHWYRTDFIPWLIGVIRELGDKL